MSITFWLIVIAGYLAGGALSTRWTKRVVARISDNSPRPKQVRSAGSVAAIVAAIPALFFATVLGGSVGGAIGSNLAARLNADALAQNVVMGVCVGLGALFFLTLIVVTTAAAGATFMKVYLAPGDSE